MPCSREVIDHGQVGFVDAWGVRDAGILGDTGVPCDWKYGDHAGKS